MKASDARSTPCCGCSASRARASLARLAVIVRGADTARPDLAPEAAGLLAISLGLSELSGDDDHGAAATRLRRLRCLVRVAALCRGRTPQLAGESRLT